LESNGYDVGVSYLGIVCKGHDDPVSNLLNDLCSGGLVCFESALPKKEEEKGKEEESRFGIPEVEDFISVIKFFVRLIMAIVIGPIALPFILIVGLIHLFTGGSGNNT